MYEIKTRFKCLVPLGPSMGRAMLFTVKPEVYRNKMATRFYVKLLKGHLTKNRYQNFLWQRVDFAKIHQNLRRN